MPTFPPPLRQDKVHSVLLAARTVFLTHGFSAATTDMIQRQAGISKATLYACYPNKEALFAAVIAQECASMAASVHRLEHAPGNIARTLSELGLAYLHIVLSPTGLALLRVVIAEAPRFPELARGFYLAGPKAFAILIAEKLQQASLRNEIDIHTVGIDAAATLFLSLLRGEGQMECLTHPDAQPSAEQIDRWVRLAVMTFLGAFGVSRNAIAPDAEMD